MVYLVIDASSVTVTTHFEDELDKAATYPRQQSMRPLPEAEAKSERNVLELSAEHYLTGGRLCSAISSGHARYVLG